jgi:hypothetical protein
MLPVPPLAPPSPPPSLLFANQTTHNGLLPHPSNTHTHTPHHPARYLAELVKFRLAAPSSLLLRLKALLDDFSGPHVEAATTLVENAGRFLLRVPGESAQQGFAPPLLLLVSSQSSTVTPPTPTPTPSHPCHTSFHSQSTCRVV